MRVVQNNINEFNKLIESDLSLAELSPSLFYLILPSLLLNISDRKISSPETKYDYVRKFSTVFTVLYSFFMYSFYSFVQLDNCVARLVTATYIPYIV